MFGFLASGNYYLSAQSELQIAVMEISQLGKTWEVQIGIQNILLSRSQMRGFSYSYSEQENSQNSVCIELWTYGSTKVTAKYR